MREIAIASLPAIKPGRQAFGLLRFAQRCWKNVIVIKERCTYNVVVGVKTIKMHPANPQVSSAMLF
jgi:hypothetical protein